MLEARSLPPPPASAGPTLSPSQIQELRDWVRSHFGISFSVDKSQVFEQRLKDFISSHKVTAQQLIDRVKTGDRALTLRFAEAMSTNYTYFFREEDSFEFVERTVLPAIPGQVRIWCAAASSGDEPYSLAISAQERRADASTAVRILGTDLSERQLSVAEQGVYPAHQLAHVNEARRSRWFRSVGLGQFQINDEIKRMCTFRRLNLTAEVWPFEQRFHLIFLRNVLYYFDPPLRLQILERCYDATEPGGWLVTSHTEPLLDLKSRWRQRSSALYQKAP